MRVGRCLHIEVEDNAGDANREVKGVDATKAISLLYDCFAVLVTFSIQCVRVCVEETTIAARCLIVFSNADMWTHLGRNRNTK